ncbi:MAG: 50S ribosomal protein L11 methyltransferase [Cyanobacteria bacterium HKST-UBA04]|nr:50S ribosomal protein L11 methyltransferase [Cyanobacteria bacterium HKST-UBA04]MCA9841837.1 50S ribosomal protein L11 methyltransferase [Cyanobacteria bacterium HKST-UBA03]
MASRVQLNETCTPADSAALYRVFINGVQPAQVCLIEEWLWTLPSVVSVECRYDGIEHLLGMEVIASAPDLDGQLQACLAQAGVGAADLEIQPPQPVADADWAEAWKAFWPVTRLLPNLVIQPSWEPYEPGPDETVLHLDPGMAFGTGSHETTRLMLLALDTGLAQAQPWCSLDQAILDLGTGSGVLSVYLGLKGASGITAVDILPETVVVTQDNMRRNALPDTAIDVSTTPLAQLPTDTYGLVVANILAHILASLLPDIGRVLKPGGTVLLGGITVDRYAEFKAVLDTLPFTLRQVWVQGQWVALRMEWTGGSGMGAAS